MNSAEARSSFSPPVFWKRLVDRIQISSGMLKMRVSVMELGRFTGDTKRRVRTTSNYPPVGTVKAMKERAGR